MPVEIERKFLVASDDWRKDVQRSRSIIQGYFPKADGYCVRIRIMDNRDAYLTIKSSAKDVTARAEFEYPIPLDHARDMLSLFCERPYSRTISKIRHYACYGAHTWEIDQFQDHLAPLVVAEVELSTPDELLQLPPWVGAEVTNDYHYANEFLACGNSRHACECRL